MPIEGNTHGLLLAGAGATTATETNLGTISLPAGGPWLIHDVFALVANATATAAELTGGYFRFDAASGDLTPQPAPSRFPVRGATSTLGATIDRSTCKLNLFPVAWEAPGKANIDIIVANNTTNTVAPQWICGLLFGKSRPEKKPIIFCDQVRGTIAAAAAAAVGTITLAEKATRITGICAILNQTGVLVTAEELLGFITLSSDDVVLPPSQYPVNCAYGAGLGALIQGGSDPYINFIPVDIPVEGGARIAANIDLNTAVTNAADIQVFIAYE